MSIDFTRDGHIATVRINRPDKLNALTLAMYDDLGRVFFEIKDDDGIRAVVLTGAGDRAFCVGADLTESIPALASDRFDISMRCQARKRRNAAFRSVNPGAFRYSA